MGITGIKKIILQTMLDDSAHLYRQPLVGVADAKDPLFSKIREWAHPEHQAPHDILPGAKSVVVWFLPFSAALVEDNRQDKFVARSWAEAYIHTNTLLTKIAETLQKEFASCGFKAAFAAPTHNFDEEKLVAPWSHRHVAYIAGLGEFGVNRMLITPAGCAGRFGSLVTTSPLPATARVPLELCQGKQEGIESCHDCQDLCPTGALHRDGTFDRQRCWEWVQAVDRYFKDLGTSDVCGKCCLGRCAILGDGDGLNG